MSVNRIVRIPGSRASAPPPGSKTKKYFCDVRLYLDDFLGQQSVRFTMDALCCLRVWRIHEAKNFVASLVHPVLVVLNAVFPLRFHILRVSLCDIFRGSSLREIVNVHV